ncbi:hypothetical protein L596_024194 [Steinernema carpocapsae]|uniref:C-type lectin domain-containing protein n=1 Tax=Steinernema carpocapsae TaxID=34508 RepID=A0A4U5MG14_STECR|nr:hypothetical protein L596_024194 [Steinernema carpocapsae]
MLRTIVVFAVLVEVAHGLFEIPAQFMTEEELMAKYPLDNKDIQAVQCDDIIFQHVQQAFNVKLNINANYTWKDSALLLYNIDRLLKNTDFQNYINVCQARQGFYGGLGANYFACVNRYYLLGKPGATWTNVMQYIQLFAKLDFICNAGFEVAQPNWPCITSTEGKNLTEINACKNAFISTGTSDHWQHLCDGRYLPQYAGCVQNVFQQTCDNEVGWLACEDIRVEFRRDCFGSDFRCHPN